VTGQEFTNIVAIGVSVIIMVLCVIGMINTIRKTFYFRRWNAKRTEETMVYVGFFFLFKWLISYLLS
jgi:hypothetical protein